MNRARNVSDRVWASPQTRRVRGDAGHSFGSARGGGILVVALVCLVILGVLQVLLVKSALAHRRLSREQAHRHQARWLAEAGMERAAARLVAEPDYRGETWQVAAEDLFTSGPSPSEAASVEIEVRMTSGEAEDAGRRVLHVRAAYPRDLPWRVLYEKQVTVSLPRDR